MLLIKNDMFSSQYTPVMLIRRDNNTRSNSYIFVAAAIAGYGRTSQVSARLLS